MRELIPIRFAITYARLCRKYNYNKDVFIVFDRDNEYYDREGNEGAYAHVTHSYNNLDEGILSRSINFNYKNYMNPRAVLVHEFCHLLQYDSGIAYTNTRGEEVLEEDVENCVSEYAKTSYLEMQAEAFEHYEYRKKIDERVVKSLSELLRVYSYRKKHEREGYVGRWDKNNIIHSLRFNFGPLTTHEVLKACKTEKFATKSFIHHCESLPFI